MLTTIPGILSPKIFIKSSTKIEKSPLTEVYYSDIESLYSALYSQFTP